MYKRCAQATSLVLGQQLFGIEMCLTKKGLIMKTRLFIILITSLLLACDKDDEGISNELKGQWNWKSTCGGVVGCVSSTPDYRMTMQISETDMVTTVSNKDGTNLTSSSYLLIERQDQGGNTIYKIKFTNGTILTLTVNRDNLSITRDDFIFSSSYQRLV